MVQLSHPSVNELSFSDSPCLHFACHSSSQLRCSPCCLPLRLLRRLCGCDPLSAHFCPALRHGCHGFLFFFPRHLVFFLPGSSLLVRFLFLDDWNCSLDLCVCILFLLSAADLVWGEGWLPFLQKSSRSICSGLRIFPFPVLGRFRLVITAEAGGTAEVVCASGRFPSKDPASSTSTCDLENVEINQRCFLRHLSKEGCLVFSTCGTHLYVLLSWCSLFCCIFRFVVVSAGYAMSTS